MFLWNTHSKKNTVVPGQSAKRWLLWLSKQQPKLRRSGLYRSRFRSICRLPLMKKKIAEAVRMVECILFLKICPQGIFQLLFKFNILCPSTLCSHSHPGNREFLPHFWWTLKLAAKKKICHLAAQSRWGHRRSRSSNERSRQGVLGGDVYLLPLFFRMLFRKMLHPQWEKKICML